MSERSIRRAVGVGTTTAVGASVFFAPSAEAATFTVTSTADTGAEGTLRKEIQDANALDGDDVIVFQAGLSGTITLTGGEIPIIYDGLEIQGPGADEITISGNDASRIFDLYRFQEPDEDVIVSGLTLSDGNVTERGGAIRSQVGQVGPSFAAHLTISDAVLTDNRSATEGGAIAADGGQDGASLSVIDSVISGNRGVGPGVDGGGISAEATELVVEDSEISGNHATYDGGGIYFLGDGTGLTVTGSTLSGNSANGRGGGAITAFRWDGPLVIENSTLSGNTGRTVGGGAYLYSELDQPTTIRNSTIADNTSGNRGGGVYHYAFDNEGVGGADDVTISSSIVADNTVIGASGTQGDLDDQGSAAVGEGSFVLGFSLIEDDGDSAITESTVGSNIFNTDPQLNGLGPAGGPTETQVPAATSPVLDAGIPNSLTTDQRGLARTVDLRGRERDRLRRHRHRRGRASGERGDADVDRLRARRRVADQRPNPDVHIQFPRPERDLRVLARHRDSELLRLHRPELHSGVTAGQRRDPHLPCARDLRRRHRPDPGDPHVHRRYRRAGDQHHLRPRGRVDDRRHHPDLRLHLQRGRIELPVRGPGRVRGAELRRLHGPRACSTPPTRSPTAPTPSSSRRPTRPATRISTAAERTFTVDTSGPPPPPPPPPPGDDGDPPPVVPTADCQGDTVPRQEGTDAADTLTGTGGGDAILGLDGDDTVKGGGGADCLDGGAGKDKVSGGGGKDKLKGGAGRDTLKGGGGKDKLNCGGGKDKAIAQPADKVFASCEKVRIKG